MKKAIQVIFLIFVVGVLGYFFYDKMQSRDSAIDTTKLKRKVVSNEKVYELIPREELFENDAIAQQQLAELKNRYQKAVANFKSQLDENNVKLVFCWITTEVGVSKTIVQRETKAFIQKICQENNIEFVDFSSIIAQYGPTEITHMPVDGHFNEKGSEIIAKRLKQIIDGHDKHRSTLNFSAAERPSILGELEPSEDLILDGGKNLPYRLITNASGMRMSKPLRFDNDGQRVLLMGDSGFYFPFVDNDETATDLLQSYYPKKEIMNVANYAYTITDYISQYEARAKYLEPDLILLQASGDDLPDLFFTHQQRFSRDRYNNSFKPSETEREFYKYLEKQQK